jgi:predicted RNase H-like HicB family nuclease
MNIRVILEADDEVGGFSATCPELNYLSSCGETREEALENFEEALKLFLRPIPEQFLQLCSHNVEYRELAI